MVGKFIARLLRKAGYELISSDELTAVRNFTYSLDERVDGLEDTVGQLEDKVTEMDSVICSTMECVEEIRDAKPVEPPRQSVDSTAAQILNEYFYGYQPSRGDNE